MLRASMLGACFAGALAAQAAAPVVAAPQSPTAPTTPTLHVAFADDSAGDGPPALGSLRRDVLALRPEWPTSRAPSAAFTLHLDERGLRIGEGLALPHGTVAAGEVQFANGATATFAIARSGHDELRLRGDRLPAPFDPLATALRLAVDGAPRLVDLAALVGNLAGPVLDGDPDRAQLPLLAAQCGEVTFAALREGDHVLVRGGSDGGLALPLTLLWLAARDAAPLQRADDALGFGLRAFGGRDGDRAEAVRQLQRTGAAALPGLRALLHADEECRTAAIDGLVRLRAVAELPRIVAAAAPGFPLATAMARTAIAELWPLATAPIRGATRAALRRSDALDENAVPSLGNGDEIVGEAAPAVADPRLRTLIVLGLLGIGLFGLWQRERARQRLDAAHA